MFLFRKKGQLSLEFSMILLVIMLLSLVSIYHFLDNNLNENDKVLDKIDVGAKTAVSLVNSRYNGTYNEYPISYLGMTSNGKNITIWVSTEQLSDQSREFIKNYIYDSQKIDDEYNITVKKLEG
jgi:uncharacterized protein (UPF0333 family)